MKTGLIVGLSIASIPIVLLVTIFARTQPEAQAMLACKSLMTEAPGTEQRQRFEDCYHQHGGRVSVQFATRTVIRESDSAAIH